MSWPFASPPPEGGLGSLAELLDQRLAAHGRRPAIRVDTGAGYRSISFQDYAALARQLARYLQLQGAEQRVLATWCKNRLEWDLCALAAFHTANILFPLDTKFHPAELEHLLALDPPDYILLSYAQLPRFRELKRRLGLTAVALLADLQEAFEDLGIERPPLQAGELSLKAACQLGLDGVQALQASPRLAEPGLVLGHYATSGTVALPKVVAISHAAMLAELRCSLDVIKLRPNEDVLNIGPYTHIATLVEFLVSKARGYTVTYFTREPDDDGVLEAEIAKLAALGARIKVLMAVPKFWSFLVKEALEEMKNKPVLRRLYERLGAIERNGALVDLDTLEKAKLTAMRILLRNKLGGYFSYGISSSTKLDPALVLILGQLGITVIDVYGATECTGIIARNRLNDIVPGSCGKLIPELDYRLTDLRPLPPDGQQAGLLWVKGPTVAAHYVGRGSAGEPIAAEGDGYYCTGDLCWVDEQRQVRLIGRQRELLAWDDGTLIDPQHLSNLLTRGIFIKDAMAVRLHPGDAFLSVFVLPDYARLDKDPGYRQDLAAGVRPPEALKRRLAASIRRAEALTRISPPLSTEPIHLLTRRLERTPTHKIKFLYELQRLGEAQAL